MSVDSGVFAVARSLWDDADFPDEVFSQREAWVWLISAAAWRAVKVRRPGGPVALERGEFCHSLRFLSEKWGWQKGQVERFLARLKKRDMIQDASRDNEKIYKIKNYNDFQVVGLPKTDTNREAVRESTGKAPGHEPDKEETFKHSNIEETLVVPAPVGAPVVSHETLPFELPPLPACLERRTPSKALVVVQSLPHWLPLDAWSAYLEMRRKKRAAPTPHAVDLLLKRLGKWVQAGHDPTEILDASTRSNWTDIYEPKSGKAHGHSKPNPHRGAIEGAALYIASLGGHDDGCGEGEAGDDADPARLPLLEA